MQQPRRFYVRRLTPGRFLQQGQIYQIATFVPGGFILLDFPGAWAFPSPDWEAVQEPKMIPWLRMIARLTSMAQDLFK